MLHGSWSRAPSSPAVRPRTEREATEDAGLEGCGQAAAIWRVRAGEVAVADISIVSAWRWDRT
eukprot:4279899-Pyramimonas_sp.AAC.1